MGGEGGGVLSDWIGDLAEHSGYGAQTTSVPGVAQRTGSTIYYVEIFPEEPVRAAGKLPVLALMPVPGEVDVVLAPELMEAGRAIQRGLVTPDRTTLIASTHHVYSMTEKTAIGDGRVDSGTLIEACRAASKTLVQDDFERIAGAKRSVISAVLFGALAGSAALPFRPKSSRRPFVGAESASTPALRHLPRASGPRRRLVEGRDHEVHEPRHDCADDVIARVSTAVRAGGSAALAADILAFS